MVDAPTKAIAVVKLLHADLKNSEFAVCRNRSANNLKQRARSSLAYPRHRGEQHRIGALGRGVQIAFDLGELLVQPGDTCADACG